MAFRETEGRAFRLRFFAQFTYFGDVESMGFCTTLLGFNPANYGIAVGVDVVDVLVFHRLVFWLNRRESPAPQNPSPLSQGGVFQCGLVGV